MNANPFYEPYWSDSLEHHGVLGMSWGERNGPPYPLDRTKSGAISEEQKESAKRHSNQEDPYFSKAKKRINKKALAIGAIAATSVLAAYGLHKTGALRTISDATHVLSKIGSDKFGSVSDFKRKSKSVKSTLKSIKDDAKVINSEKGTVNCVACSAAYDLRRRGLDVTAKNGVFDFAMGIQLWYKNPNVQAIYDEKATPKMTYDAIQKALEQQGSGARGIICSFYNNPFGKSAGHAISYEVIDKKPVFIDAQIGKVLSDPYGELFSHLTSGRYALITRLDDVEPDYDYIKELVKNR